MVVMYARNYFGRLEGFWLRFHSLLLCILSLVSSGWGSRLSVFFFVVVDGVLLAKWNYSFSAQHLFHGALLWYFLSQQAGFVGAVDMVWSRICVEDTAVGVWSLTRDRDRFYFTVTVTKGDTIAPHAFTHTRIYAMRLGTRYVFLMTTYSLSIQ